MAYEAITGPLGGSRDDVLAAMVCERVTNMMRDPKSKALRASDFLPRWGETEVEDDGGDPQESDRPPGGRR